MRRTAIVAAAMVTALATGLAVHAVEPGFALAVLAGLSLTVLVLKSIRVSLWASLAFKPIIDIFYDQRIGSVTLQRVFGVIAPLLGVLALAGARVDVLAFPMAAPLCWFAITNAIGAVLSADVIEGAQVFFRMVGPVVFYFAAALILPDDAAVKRFVRTGLLVLIVPYGYSLLQLVGILPSPTVELTAGLEAVRLIGPYSHPWDLARYLVVSVPFCLLQVTESRGTERAAWWVYLTANLTIAVFTNLRYAQVAVFLELLIWFVLTRQRVKFAVALVGGSALVAANARFLSQMWADVTVLFVSPGTSATAQALSGRVGVWDWYVTRLGEMPVVYRILGTGLDYDRITRGGVLMTTDPHNDILRVLISNGWLGLLVYVWLLLAMAVFLARCVSRLRASGDAYRLKLAQVTVCVYVSYVAGSLTARPSQYPSLAWYMWVLFGLLAATMMAGRQESRNG